ncbi:MAG TPA: flagellar brake protein [Noviherbaspirillum sp.]|nr:flagellar brake protein [Noviherbaspirillum sp.]
MAFEFDDDTLDLSRYRVYSRREIINLLRTLSARNQLVRMQANNGADAVITSILEVDETNDNVIIDRAPSATTNQRILESDEIAFETVLENIRILFFASHVHSCTHDERPALCMTIPESLIRLQRREYYRVPTPVATPVRCTFTIPDETGQAAGAVAVPLHNISAGGIAVADEKKLIPASLGAIFEKCRIDLPGGAIEVKLELMNINDLKLTSGKTTRRLGFMFVDIPNATLSAVQRYITKLEREQNARATGMV